ncbi:hypothetical protein M885DRAFT_531043 [Pelagophyceae sp. CCMP2097]|nr:hypothetical protein M885DRAFT_531043 [Pelagophyceae sp. CCMP2097]
MAMRAPTCGMGTERSGAHSARSTAATRAHVAQQLVQLEATRAVAISPSIFERNDRWQSTRFSASAMTTVKRGTARRGPDVACADTVGKYRNRPEPHPRLAPRSLRPTSKKCWRSADRRRSRSVGGAGRRPPTGGLRPDADALQLIASGFRPPAASTGRPRPPSHVPAPSFLPARL